MTKFKGVNLRKTLIEKIDEAVETIKNPSGTKKYRSRAAFVTNACEELFEKELIKKRG